MEPDDSKIPAMCRDHPMRPLPQVSGPGKRRQRIPRGDGDRVGWWCCASGPVVNEAHVGKVLVQVGTEPVMPEFRKHRDVGIMARDRFGDRLDTSSAAVADVPGNQACHGVTDVQIGAGVLERFQF